MKFCPYDCQALCDFCIHFAYNGGDGAEIISQVYIGDGFCKIDGSNRWPEDRCENFVCHNWIHRHKTLDELRAARERRYGG